MMHALPLRFALLSLVVAGCHVDRLLHAHTNNGSTSLRLVFSTGPRDVPAGAAMMPAVQVSVTDTGGVPVTSFEGDVTISLAANPAGGKLLSTRTVGAVAGVATFSDLRLDRAGTYTLTAIAPGAASDTSASFAVTPGAASRLAFTVQPNGAMENAAFEPPPEVTAYDAWGNAVVSFGGTVTLSIGQNPGTHAKGRLTGTASAKAAKGIAKFTGLGIDQPGSGYTLVAAFGAGSPVGESAPFDVGERVATKLAFSTQPSTTETGVAIAPPVQVTVVDNSGATVTRYSGPVTIALGANPGSASLSGTLTVNAVNGVATFGDLEVSNAGSGYTLTAAASGLASATSTPFDVNARATQLVFVTQPQSANRNATLVPPIVVAAVDDEGNLVTSYGGKITIALGSNPGNASLSGTRSKSASSGVVSFSDLKVNRTANGYTLVISADGLRSATSAYFNIR